MYYSVIVTDLSHSLLSSTATDQAADVWLISSSPDSVCAKYVSNMYQMIFKPQVSTCSLNYDFYDRIQNATHHANETRCNGRLKQSVN